MLIDSCGGAGCTGEHTLHRQQTRHCRCGPAGRLHLFVLTPHLAAQRQRLVLQDGGTYLDAYFFWCSKRPYLKLARWRCPPLLPNEPFTAKKKKT
jgi:hypothetical protein